MNKDEISTERWVRAAVAWWVAHWRAIAIRELEQHAIEIRQIAERLRKEAP